jgi:hypothetical protein
LRSASMDKGMRVLRIGCIYNRYNLRPENIE